MGEGRPVWEHSPTALPSPAPPQQVTIQGCVTQVRSWGLGAGHSECPLLWAEEGLRPRKATVAGAALSGPGWVAGALFRRQIQVLTASWGSLPPHSSGSLARLKHVRGQSASGSTETGVSIPRR